MSDQPPPPLPLPQPPPVEPVTIPLSLSQKWGELRFDQFLEARLSRVDLDHFYSAFDKNLLSQHALQECLVQWTNGNTIDANNNLNNARRLLQESQNSFRLFFMALMVSAITPQTYK